MTIPVMSSRFFMCPSSVNGTLPSVRSAPVYTGAYMWIERALLSARCGDTAAGELLTGIRPSRLTRAGVALEPVVGSILRGSNRPWRRYADPLSPS